MHTYRPIIFVQDWEDDYMGDSELAQLLDDGDAQAIVEYLAQWDNHEDDRALAQDWPTWRGGAGSRDDSELVEYDTFTYLLTINHGLRYVGLDRLITD